MEKKIREPLKELHQLDIIDKKTYEKLCPFGSHFGILYGLAKVHKQLLNNCPPFDDDALSLPPLTHTKSTRAPILAVAAMTSK